MSNGATTAEPKAAQDRSAAQDRFRRFMEGLDETGAATDRRREAWDTYASLPMPSTQSEEWRYTDVSDLRPVEDFVPVAPSAPASLAREELPDPVLEVLAGEQDRSGVAVEVNGRTVHRSLDDDLVDRGVIFARLDEVARSRPELLQRWLYASDVAEMEAKFWSLHVALLTEGYLLYVPDGVDVANPVHVLRWIDREGVLVATHSLIVAGEDSEVTCMDEYLSPDLASPSLSVNGVEIVGGRNATVRYLSLGRFGRGVEHFSVQHAMAGRDTTLSGFNVALGGDRIRADVTSHLQGPGSESEMLALWFGDGDQHFDHHTLQHHAAPHAYSDLLYKGALEGRAESVFRGLIRVDEGAQLTDAYQTNRNLLLSEESHAITLPNLEIEADDVRCSHGATVGQVDPSMMFYLMSRGLTRSQAERLLVFGFFDEVLDRMPVAGARRRVGDAIEQKIGL
ncbi:MAG: Fe-S cluster assembly protein SufD [Gemmatimonadota bacterium]